MFLGVEIYLPPLYINTVTIQPPRLEHDMETTGTPQPKGKYVRKTTRVYKTKTGRPTKYNADTVRLTREYTEQEIVAGEYPTVMGLALTLKINEDDIVEWAKIYPEFSAAVKELKLAGHKILVKKALNETYNPGFAKFLLLNNFGYTSEKTENKNTHEFPSGIDITFV
jgi:hypothetical protein